MNSTSLNDIDKKHGKFIKHRFSTPKNLSFIDGIFDTVIANHVLQIVPNIKKAIAEANRVLKPHGSFIFSLMSNDHYKELADVLMEFNPMYVYNLIRRFSLESEKKELYMFFSHYDEHVYTSRLEIPDPALITSVALSIFNGIKFPDLRPHAAEFEDHVKSKMRNGVFPITIKYGLYICRK